MPPLRAEVVVHLRQRHTGLLGDLARRQPGIAVDEQAVARPRVRIAVAVSASCCMHRPFALLRSIDRNGSVTVADRRQSVHQGLDSTFDRRCQRSQSPDSVDRPT